MFTVKWTNVKVVVGRRKAKVKKKKNEKNHSNRRMEIDSSKKLNHLQCLPQALVSLGL